MLTEDELTRITDSMFAQMQYLKENYLPKYKTSNWGSIQTCAIVSVLPFLRADFQSNPLYQWALDEMALQFSIQVYPDGMHWEQSTMYHIEVLNYGMKTVHYMGLHLQPCPSVVKEQVYALAKALAGQLMPPGEIETFGDSDRVCARDVLSRAALLFDDSTFRFVGLDELDPESLYVLGVPAAQRYATLPASAPQSMHYDGEDSGMYTLRSSWDKNASFTMFTNGSLGSGHGHSDNLHLSACYQGDPVLIDSGRFTYREDHPLRVQLKGMAAHNGVMIDDKAYCVPSDSWGYADFGLPLKNYVRHAGNLHYFEGAMLGHDPLQVWVRKVIVIDPAIWMIVDEVKCDGAHEAHSRLHFDPAVTVSPAGDCHRVTTPHAALTLTCPGTVSYTSEPCSLRYNEQRAHGRAQQDRIHRQCNSDHHAVRRRHHGTGRTGLPEPDRADRTRLCAGAQVHPVPDRELHSRGVQQGNLPRQKGTVLRGHALPRKVRGHPRKGRPQAADHSQSIIPCLRAKKILWAAIRSQDFLSLLT